MKHINQFLVLALVTLATGCATPYMVDRGRDAKDVFTATVGTGLGAKARVGPINAGLFTGADFYGLRGGEFAAFGNYVDCFWDLSEVDFLVYNMEAFAPHEHPTILARNKCYAATGPLIFSLPRKVPEGTSGRSQYQVLTQVDVLVLK